MNTKKRLLFDQIDRQIIKEFYEKSKTKSKIWVWWKKPIIVAQYERSKAEQKAAKECKEGLEKVFSVICVLDKYFTT